MRSDALALALLCLAACDEKSDGPAPERFASVKKKADAKASAFCDKSYAAKERPLALPGLKRDAAPRAAKGWTWLNLWATWCNPCVEEMGLLTRWREAFERERLAVGFELLSIDEPDVDLDGWLKGKTLPGHVSQVRSQDEFARFLDSLGLDKNAAIPIHVLVDPDGAVRCVRVGAIHQENYGAVRGLLGGT